jgi:hypothetical protein
MFFVRGRMRKMALESRIMVFHLYHAKLPSISLPDLYRKKTRLHVVLDVFCARQDAQDGPGERNHGLSSLSCSLPPISHSDL